MFKISKTKTYLWPVTVELPTDKGLVSETFKAQFKRISQSRFQEIVSEIGQGTLTDILICKEVMVGWAEIEDDDGSQMQFSDAAFEKLLDVAKVPAAIVRSFFDSITGSKGAREKN